MDSMGDEQEIVLPGFSSGHDAERFRDKTQQFLKTHENDPVIHKLRFNESLTKEDLNALEKMLADARCSTLRFTFRRLQSQRRGRSVHPRTSDSVDGSFG